MWSGLRVLRGNQACGVVLRRRGSYIVLSPVWHWLIGSCDATTTQLLACADMAALCLVSNQAPISDPNAIIDARRPI